MVVTVFYVLLIEFCCMKPLRAALRDNVFLSHTYNDDQLRSRNQSSCRCWNDALVIIIIVIIINLDPPLL